MRVPWLISFWLHKSHLYLSMTHLCSFCAHKSHLSLTGIFIVVFAKLMTMHYLGCGHCHCPPNISCQCHQYQQTLQRTNFIISIWGCNHGNFFQGINYGDVPEGTFREDMTSKEKKALYLGCIDRLWQFLQFFLAQSVTMHSNSHPFNDFVEPTKVQSEGRWPCREVRLWRITVEDARLHFVCQLHCVHPWGLNAIILFHPNKQWRLWGPCLNCNLNAFMPGGAQSCSI